MHGVLNLAVRSELGLDILVSQQPHFRGEVPPVSAEQTAVEVNWWKEGHRTWRQALP
jgi:hypothetical protein